MPRTCLACASPKRTEIDAAIVSGEPLRDIARRVSLSKDAISRHKAHASASLMKASERREESIAAAVLRQLQNLCQRTEHLLTRAEKRGADRTFLLGVRELRECLAGVYKLTSDAAATNPSHNPSGCPHCSPEQYRQAMVSSVRVALGIGGTLQKRIETNLTDEPLTLETWGSRKTMTSGSGNPVPFTLTEAQPTPEPQSETEPKPTAVFYGNHFAPGEDWKRR